MKNLIIFIIAIILMGGCCAPKLPRNQIETSSVDEVRFYNRQLTPESQIVVQELDDIKEQIIQANKLGFKRIYLTGGIYNDTAKEESQWSSTLQSIVRLLRQDGYTCEDYYKNIYGPIEKNKVDIGLRVTWDAIDDTGNVY